MLEDSEIQRIARLTPLADVLASFDLSIGPVAPREESLANATGLTLAADIVTAAEHPASALAIRDGYAVRAEQTLDASAYVPAPLTPAPLRVDTGDALPPHADAVAALDTVQVRGAQVSALAALASGDGVIAAGSDAPARLKVRLAGAALRRLDVALLGILGVERVLVREPRVHVVCANPGGVARGAAALIASSIGAESGRAIAANSLDAAIASADADAIVAIGGTGSGRNDTSVRTLARAGKVAFHGIGIAPGETAALGFVGTRPVLLLPGRIDAAMAAWLTVGRRMLARLAFRMIEEQPFAAELARKVASPLGLAEVVPIRRRLGRVEPLAQGYWPLQALARAEGWILVPADSEGHAEGSRVIVRPWP